MKKTACLVLSLIMVLGLVACGNNEKNSGENSGENSTETETVFGMLSFNFDDVNEKYEIEIIEDGEFNGSKAVVNRDGFTNTDKKPLLEESGSTTDWMTNYDTIVYAFSGISKESIIKIRPVDILKDEYKEYDTKFQYIRRFGVNYLNFLLKAGSDEFTEMEFDYKNTTISIKDNKGIFSCFFYPFREDEKNRFFGGEWYQVFLYADTEETTDIIMSYDEENKAFTLKSDKPISKIYTEVTTDDNEYVEQTHESLVGTEFKITFNSDASLNIKKIN